MTKFSLSNPIHFLALGFGCGLLKPAPGTWGTLAAVPIYLGLVHVFGPASLAYFLVATAGFILGIYLCGKAATDVGVHDHSAIVWDEIIGLLVTLSWVPPSFINLVVGFSLFRLFDIAKPWPIKSLDRHVHGGFGIMLDDLVAGVIACLLLILVQPWLPVV